MPICPKCRTEQKKRKDGRCPECGTRVSVYKGQWYREELGSPTDAIIRHFENKVSSALSAGRQVPVVFTFPRKDTRWTRELVAAERLLKDTGGDYDLVIDAIDILFSDSRYNWKSLNTLLYISKDFNSALALARSNRATQEIKKAQARQSFITVMQQEDVFA